MFILAYIISAPKRDVQPTSQLYIDHCNVNSSHNTPPTWLNMVEQALMGRDEGAQAIDSRSFPGEKTGLFLLACNDILHYPTWSSMPCILADKWISKTFSGQCNATPFPMFDGGYWPMSCMKYIHMAISLRFCSAGPEPSSFYARA